MPSDKCLEFIEQITAFSLLTINREILAILTVFERNGKILIQVQALGLYRDFLRVARKKTKSNVGERMGGDNKESIVVLARQEFEKYRSLSRKDFQRIEFLLRRGRRQLEMLKTSDVDGVTSSDMFKK